MQYHKMEKTCNLYLKNHTNHSALEIKIICDKKSIEANKNVFLDIYIKDIHRNKYNKTI